ncbi:hypothetical protein ACFCW6_36075 [Streptomyces sp. NPDC056333]|uniref:hypothetical protein n=1 Tax=Streptomyces sp. NPDC056333 TaxID=3345786 RepID=UPI0035DC2FB6
MRSAVACGVRPSTVLKWAANTSGSGGGATGPFVSGSTRLFALRIRLVAPNPAPAGTGGQGLSSRRNPAYLRRRGIRCTIPDKAAGSATARGKDPEAIGLQHSTRSTTASTTRPSAASTALKWHRAVPTRYEKLAVRYEATVLVAAVIEWL